MKNIFKQAFNNNSLSFDYAMESLSEGTGIKREDEIVIYARINNFEGLKKANSKESHEQWQVSAPFGKIRVRKTTMGDLEGSYTQAIKTRDNQVGIAGGTEQEFPVDANVFEAFKAISDNGMIKERFVFNATSITALDSTGKDRIDTSGMKYEVDVYPDGNGGYHPWCKIDVEVNDLLKSVADVKGTDAKIKLTLDVSILPIKATEMILGSTQDAEQKAKITQLYDTFFLAKKGQDGNIIKAQEVQPPVEGGDAQPTETTELTEPSEVVGDGAEQVDQVSTDTDPAATVTPVPVDGEVATDVVVDDTAANTDVVDPVDTTAATDSTDTTVDEFPETIDVVPDAEEPLSLEEQNKKALEPFIENLKGKEFEGRRSGYQTKFSDEEGNEHVIKYNWGVKGTNVMVTVKFDDEGEMTESVDKDGDGKVIKAVD